MTSTKRNNFVSILIILQVFVLNLSTMQAQDRTKWFEFYLPWNDTTKTYTDLSATLDVPAGKFGFLNVTPDGHFKFERKATPERFVGVVNVGLSNYPTKEQAALLAGRMAKFGINLVRIHLVDVGGASGLFQNSALNTLVLSTQRLDLMDYFISCLKEKGIYFNFCIQAGRMFKTADGIDSPVVNDQSKYVTLFNQKLIDLQKDFANKLFSHVNPYTKLSYNNEPAMVSVELTNENSMYNGWFGWQSDYLFADSKYGIGSYYASELDKKFNDWLIAKYGADQALSKAWTALPELGIVPELILNGSFEQNLSSWNPMVTGTAKGTITADASIFYTGKKSAKIDIGTSSSQNWHVQLRSNDIKVEKGKDYKLCFYSKALENKELYLEIMESGTWKWLAGHTYSVSTDWKKTEIFFTSSITSNALAVAFGWGSHTGTFWLDSVSVSPYSGVGLNQGESLLAKNIKRSKYSEFGKYTKARIGDNANFYFDIEKNYSEQMTDYVKNTLAVKCPVTFTNNYFGLASIYSQAQADFVDFHMYWDHPSFPNGWSETSFYLNNKSMLLDPYGSAINKMPLSKVKNKPHVLSEYNAPYPYIYQGEMPSLLYAYGSFFDLDGIMWHAYYDYMNQFSQRHQDMFFDIAMNPVVMSQMLLALPYRNGYIQEAKTVVDAKYKRQDVFDNTKIHQGIEEINMTKVNMGTAFLKQGFQHADFDADTTELSIAITDPGKIITSETGELKWNGSTGVFTVNNPYWQGTTGFLGGKTIDLKDISLSKVVTTDNMNFASIHLISLDSLPINQSKRMILLTSARLENEGLKWNESNTSLLKVGGTRALCEPVEAFLRFKLSNTDSISVYELNTKGERGAKLELSLLNTDISVAINKKTLWYEIRRYDTIVSSSGANLQKNKNGLRINSCFDKGDGTAQVDFVMPPEQSGIFFLMDKLGRNIIEQKLPASGDEHQVIYPDISRLSAGIYLAGIRMQNGRAVSKKFYIK